MLINVGVRRIPVQENAGKEGDYAVGVFMLVKDEPTFDADGYPTDETLEKIENWKTDSFQDIRDAMEFIHKAWRYEAWEYQPDVEDKEFKGQPAQDIYIFSTYGWSGNESLVGALQNNNMLRMLGAWSWRRGGHYEYRFTRW